MFLWRRPSEEQIQKFLQTQQHLTFSYKEVGASQKEVPKKYNLDHNRILLGYGERVFRAGTEAIRRWEMFHLGWVHLCWPEKAPIQKETTVAILISHFSFWSLNACRIVYCLDEKEGNLQRYGFAYGTLPEHGERGEERFLIEWNQEDDSVWYDLLAFSQPQHFLAKLGYPLTRLLQKRFAQDSKQSMFRAVSELHSQDNP